jgi:ubiquinone/menaquinone biosynthesis C-methylase UbiE
MENIEFSHEKEDVLIKSQMEKMVYTYDKYMKRITFGREDQLRKMTIDLAGVKPGNNVLEIGCATGSLTLAAKRQAGTNGRVSAIDIIPGMIEESRKKATQALLDIDFKLASMDNLPFAGDQFDVVICSFMIFHTSEKVRNKGIEEIYRVLKPNGTWLVLDISLPATSWSRSLLKLFLGFLFKHNLEELQPKTEAAGFGQLTLSTATFRVFGLPLLSYLKARKPSNL